MNTQSRYLLAAFSALGLAAALTACRTPQTGMSSATPCMDRL